MIRDLIIVIICCRKSKNFRAVFKVIIIYINFKNFVNLNYFYSIGEMEPIWILDFGDKYS